MGLALILIALAIFVGGGAVLYAVGLYNTQVQVKHNVAKAWKNIDVLLQQRHDEIPKLVEVCKGFMTHERGVLTDLTRLRSEYDAATSVAAKTRIENQLNRSLWNLRATAEAYPDLKSVQMFGQLSGRISALESNIADRREFFNEAVRVLRKEEGVLVRTALLWMAMSLGLFWVGYYHPVAQAETQQIALQDPHGYAHFRAYSDRELTWGTSLWTFAVDLDAKLGIEGVPPPRPYPPAYTDP